MLPDGFTLAPQDRWTDEIREETEGVYFSQYSDDQPNILLVGPILVINTRRSSFLFSHPIGHRQQHPLRQISDSRRWQPRPWPGVSHR